MIFRIGALNAKNGITSAHARRQAGAIEGYFPAHRGRGIGSQTAVRILDNRDQPRGVGRTLGHDLPELAQMPAQGIDRLCPLPDQKLADAKDHGRTLGLLALYRHEAHRRPYST